MTIFEIKVISKLFFFRCGRLWMTPRAEAGNTELCRYSNRDHDSSAVTSRPKTIGSAAWTRPSTGINDAMRTAFWGEPNKWGIQRSKTQSRGFFQNLGNRKWGYRLTKAVMTGKRWLNGCRISVWNDHYRPEFQSNTIKYPPYSPARPPHIPQTLIRLRPAFHPSARQNRIIL